MAKTANGRREGHQQYLRRMAEKDPKRFQEAWNQRISSLACEASRHASHLLLPPEQEHCSNQPEGALISEQVQEQKQLKKQAQQESCKIFEIFEQAKEDLRICGNTAATKEAEIELAELAAICAQEVARAYDRRLARFTSSIYRR